MVLDFLSACGPVEVALALESMETMDRKAFAAILDLICPLFGRGLLPLKLPSPTLMVLALLLIDEKWTSLTPLKFLLPDGCA